MLTAHLSDIHGNAKLFQNILPEAKVIFVSGDIFPNKTRGIVGEEIPFQTEWFAANKSEIIACLSGRTVVCVDGNHDYLSFSECLTSSGYSGKVIQVSDTKAQDIGEGFSVAGFREVPYIAGTWNGENFYPEMHSLADRTLQLGANILLTHTAPRGILADPAHGCQALATLLMYSAHNVKYHLFGHSHDGMGTTEEMGINFINSATTVQHIYLTL